MNVPWYAYAAVLLVGILAGTVATLARSIPFGLGRRLRTIALMVDHAAVAGLLILAVLDVAAWLRR